MTGGVNMKCKACGSEDFVVDERMENPWESVQDAGRHACKGRGGR